MNHAELTTVRAVLKSLVRHPFKLLVVSWNWKAAILSSTIRSLIFLAANLSAGWEAALAAMNTEFIYRVCTAGFYAALTQSFRYARPEWQATLAAMLLLPLVSHGNEWIIHWLRGTPNLALSIMASACFTAISTAYNLFAMRNGALIVGQDSQSIWLDLRRTPGIMRQFLLSVLSALRPSWRLRSLRRLRRLSRKSLLAIAESKG